MRPKRILNLIFSSMLGTTFGASVSLAAGKIVTEPKVIVGNLKPVDEIFLPTSFIDTSAAAAHQGYETYQFILDLKSNTIKRANSHGAPTNETTCVSGERSNKIRAILDRNQICDFSEVKTEREPGISCLTMVYPNYMYVPIESGSLGVGEKVDSCATPEIELCDLKAGEALREKIGTLTSDFISYLENPTIQQSQCL